MIFKKYIFTILLLLILFYIIYSLYQKYIQNEHFDNSAASKRVSSYYKCEEKPISPILEDIFKKYGISKSAKNDNKNASYKKNGMNWELYIPCGYNYVEQELPTVQMSLSPSQLYIFGINGCDKMVSKNNIWSTIKKYYGFDAASKIMPSSYVLEDKDDMQLFKRDYVKDKIYILKKNVQRKEGLKLTKDYNFITKEAVNEEYKVVQNYIRDLYLINGRKVNLRVYLLVVLDGDQKLFYISDLGKCIYTNKKYNDNDFDFESNITSYHLDMSVYKENPRTFDDLRAYINKKEDNENAGSLFFVKMNEILQKMCTALSNDFFQSDNIRERSAISFQLFGVDVIMDKDLNPYLLEVNKGPDMSARDDEDKKMKTIVQTHMFEKVGVIQDDAIHNTNVFHQIN
jgi:hypothetical protein